MSKVLIFETETGQLIKKIENDQKNLHIEFSYGNQYLLLIQEQLKFKAASPI